MKISLIGYMGAGKSTLGSELAVLSGLEYYDLDGEIEKYTGYTITETIFNKGELYFRKLEREKLEEILAKDNFVLSTGGGTPCYYDNAELINSKSISVYLQYSVKHLFERLKADKTERPLIAHLEDDALLEYIGKHVFERSVYYEKATIQVHGGNRSQEDVLKELISYTHE